MGGYTVAWSGAHAGVPCRLVTQVSDEAGDGAARIWQESMDACGGTSPSGPVGTSPES